jgi:alanine dehydrogenase
MIIGVPKEVKHNEFRVGIVPSGDKVLISAGHRGHRGEKCWRRERNK